MADLKFVRFQSEDYELYKAWCEDEEIRRWFGPATTEWRDYVILSQSSFMWMIYDGNEPVANIQVDLSEGNSSKAHLAFMVRPGFRRKGYGRQVLLLALEQPELCDVRCFYASVEPANTASVGVLSSTSYTMTSPEPDEDGFIEYTYVRSI